MDEQAAPFCPTRWQEAHCESLSAIRKTPLVTSSQEDVGNAKQAACIDLLSCKSIRAVETDSRGGDVEVEAFHTEVPFRIPVLQAMVTGASTEKAFVLLAPCTRTVTYSSGVVQD